MTRRTQARGGWVRLSLVMKSSCIVLCFASLVTAACTPKEEVIPIIHVSPGFQDRLALRPPANSVLDAAPQQAEGTADAGPK